MLETLPKLPLFHQCPMKTLTKCPVLHFQFYNLSLAGLTRLSRTIRFENYDRRGPHRSSLYFPLQLKLKLHLHMYQISGKKKSIKNIFS